MDSWFKRKGKREVSNISSPLKTSSNSQPFRRAASRDDSLQINDVSIRSSQNSDNQTINTSNSRYSEAPSMHDSEYSEYPQNEDTLNIMFEQLMDSMDMKGEKRARMREMAPDSKWMMIKSQRDREKQTSLSRIEGKLSKQTPEYYIRRMKDYNANLMPLKNFESLKISLSTETIGWVKQFVFLQGLRMLSDALAILNRKPTRKEYENLIESEVVRCMKAALNTVCGSNEALENPKIIYSLTFSIDSGNIITRKLVADALIYLCFSEDIVGHAYVIEGFDKLQKYRNYSYRFEGWLRSFNEALESRGIMGSKVGASDEIKHSVPAVERDLIDYGLSNIMLVNAIIEIPDDIELRMSIRSQLNMCGLSKIIETLKTFKNELIDIQLKKYHMEAEEDINEITDNYNSKMLKELNDPNELFQTVLKSVENITAHDSLVSILKHLIMIRSDDEIKNRYYSTIEAVVSDVVNCKKLDGENNIGISGINANNAMAKFEAVEELEKAKTEIKELKEQVQIALKKKNQLEFEAAQNHSETILVLQNKNNSLEKVVKMSKKTIEALQKKYRDLVARINAASMAEGELELKNIYSVMQEKQINENKQIQLENQVLKSGKVMKIVNNKIVLDEDMLKDELKAFNQSDHNNQKSYSASKLGNSINFEGAIKPKQEANLISKSNNPENLEFSSFVNSPLSFSPLSPEFGEKTHIDASDQKSSINPSNSGLPPPPPPPPSMNSSHIPPPPPMNSSNIPPPPPPPMNSSNIPPPPPPMNSSNIPPPPPFGNTPGSLAPPPLPHIRQIQQRKKLKITASIKLKQLQWDKLTQNTIKNTIWEVIGKSDDEYVDKLEKAGVFKKIEEKFSIKTKEIQKPTRKLSEENQKTLVLDPKRSYNINIMLGRYKKYEHSQLRIAILELDESILSEVLVKQLLNYIPTEEEKNLLEPYSATNTDQSLGKAELFMIEMLKVKRYESKLQVIYFKLCFTDSFNELDQTITSVCEASTSLMQSPSLPVFLELVLVIGNFMNAEGFRGGAYGFKLSTLTKIRDTKYNDESQFTLMHYIAFIVTNYYPELLGLGKEINALNLACRVSFNDLINDYNNMKKGIDLTKKEIDYMHSHPDPEESMFKNNVSSFLENAEKRYEMLSKRYSQMNANYFAIVSKLGEDPNSMSPDEFFGIFKNFIQTFEKCIIENNAESERQKVLSRRKLEQERSMIAEAERKKENAGALREPKTVDEDATGVMDSLLESLKSGGEFNRRKNRRLLNKANNNTENNSIGKTALQMLNELKNDV